MKYNITGNSITMQLCTRNRISISSIQKKDKNSKTKEHVTGQATSGIKGQIHR